MTKDISDKKVVHRESDISPLCRFCMSSLCHSLGNIPNSDMFAGRVVKSPIWGGQLWHCKNCDSQFRSPMLTEQEYLKLYESTGSEVWEDAKLRKDQILIHSVIKKLRQNGKILDVGCYAGQFLAALPISFERFGVEPSQAAAIKAADKGIKILGSTINDITEDNQFDFVVSIDVVEHLLDPVNFFNKSFQMLSPNGVLIISTGNPSSFAWKRIFKSRFWYVTNAEHVSYPSQKFIINLVQELGGEVIEIINFCYSNISFKRRLVKLFGQCVYGVYPKLYNLMRGVTNDGSRNPSIYSLGLFKDHHLIVMRKKL